MKNLSRIIYENFAELQMPKKIKFKIQKVVDLDNELRATLSNEQLSIYQKLDFAKMECDDMEIKLAIEYTINILKTLVDKAIEN